MTFDGWRFEDVVSTPVRDFEKNKTVTVRRTHSDHHSECILFPSTALIHTKDTITFLNIQLLTFFATVNLIFVVSLA